MGSRLHGFPCFPHSVISMACFSVRPRSRQCADGPEPQLRHVELAEFDIAGVDPEDLFVHFLEAQVLVGKHLADEDAVFMPADVATRVRSPGLEASGDS